MMSRAGLPGSLRISLSLNDVYDRLSAPEVAALRTAATKSGQSATVVGNIVSMCVQEWRGALRRHHVLAAGETIPAELEAHVLADIRYRLFTRLPGMKNLLDELRVAEWREARRVIGKLGEYVFEDAGETEPDAQVPNTGVEMAAAENRIFTREKLAGL